MNELDTKMFSYNGAYPAPLPKRVRLQSGLTVTSREDLDLISIRNAGYTEVKAQPPYDSNTQKVVWKGGQWVVEDLSQGEIDTETRYLWQEVKNTRNIRLSEYDQKVARYNSQVRMGVTPTDNISELDTYAQALRDITTQADPRNIVWPTDPSIQSTTEETSGEFSG